MLIRTLKLIVLVAAYFSTAVTFAGNWNAQTHDVYAGRFNSDSRADVLVIAKDPNGFSGIFLSDSAGSPTVQHQTWNSSFLGIDWSGGRYIAIVGNYDGINGADVFLQSVGNGSSFLLLSDADGRLYAIHDEVSGWGTDVYRAVAGDFDGNTRTDLFLQARNASGTNSVVLSDTAGRLTTVADSWGNTRLGFRWSVADALVYAGDFNADGRDDLLVQAKPSIVLIDYEIPIPVPVFRPQAFGITLATTSAQFTAIQQLWNRNDFGVDWSTQRADIVIGDFGGDARDDVMLVGRQAGQSSFILLTNSVSQISSAPSQTFVPGTSGTNWTASDYRMLAADFNGDGRSEIYRQAVSSSDSNSIVAVTSSGTLSTVTTHSAPAIGSSGLSFSKTETIGYQDDTSKWVLDQVKSITVNGVQEQRTDYNSNSLPYQTFAFGKLRHTYDYWSSGLLKTSTDGNNNPINFEDYYRGIPRTIRFADNTTQTASVNDNGWITDTTDEAGAKSCYSHDSMGRLASTTFPSESTLGVCNQTTWTAQSISFVQLTAPELVVIPAGSWRLRTTLGRMQTTNYYDGMWRPVLTEEKDTTTNQVIYRRHAYDSEGRAIYQSYPATSTAAAAGINTTYDAIGRLYERRTTDNTLLEGVAYLSGNRKQVTDADGRVTVIVAQSFDSPSESIPVRIEASENQVTDIVRDVFGAITSITQSGSWSGGFASATRRFEFDAYHRPCRRTDPESGSTVWGYDAGGRVAWEAKGQSGTGCLSTAPAGATAYGYDLRDRKLLDNYPGTAEDVIYTYYPTGYLNTVTNPTATWVYTYNKRGLLETEQATVDSRVLLLDPAYNSLGQVASLTTPTRSVAYVPDAWGRPTQVGAYVGSIQYHPNNLPHTYTLGNGLTYTQTLTARMWPDVQETKSGSTAIQKFKYYYSDAGDLTTLDDQVYNTNDMSATYDNLHRLATASGVWGTHAFTYDTLNNIRSRGATNPLSYVYDINNRLATITGSQTRNYSYNDRGEITGDGAKTFELNSLGQITSFAGVATYGYDGNAKRIKVTKAGVSEYALYSRAGALAYTEKGTEKTDFLTLNGQMLVELKQVSGVTTPTYLHADLLGSPRLATNASQSVLWQEHYDSYGSKLNGVNDKIGYTGHSFDPESNYTYAQARFYDAQVGRFLSTDPIHFADTNPFTFNRYAYGNNNPFRFTDPTGMQSTSESDELERKEIEQRREQIEQKRKQLECPPGNCQRYVAPETLESPDENAMDSRGHRGNQGQGERSRTSKAERPDKGVKPIRDKEGKVVGWTQTTADGKGKTKSLEWGKQQGLNPEDYAKSVSGPNAEAIVGGMLVIGAVVCAIAEPCGAAVATAAGVGGATVLAVQ